MQAVYRHTQVGYVMIAAFAFGVLAPLAAARVQPFGVGMLFSIGLLLLVLCLGLFATLTTTVYSDRLSCHFGVGIIHRNIALAEIASVSVVRTHLLSGWGLRLSARGWMWNVSGFDAVELVFRDGRRFRLGSDEAAALCSALQSQLPADSGVGRG